jgi:hypothetical protein
MTKLTILGAAVVLSSFAGGPAVAQHMLSGASHGVRSTYCATPEPGNPLAEKFDCMTWRSRRRPGDWDNRGNDFWLRDPGIRHRERGF